jgi:hypothetical protein
VTSKRWIRLGGAAALAAGMAAGWASPGPLHASANFGCKNLDPIKSQNALTATIDTAGRPWDQIQSVAVSAGPTLAGINEGSYGSASASIPQLAIAVTTCATAKPSFPAVVGTESDSGANWNACFELDPGASIAGGGAGLNGTQIGFNPDPGAGNPINDGPFPPSQGWRFCSFATINAGLADDSGVATFDVIGQYNQDDLAVMKDNGLGTASVKSTISPATYTINGSGFLVVTMYVPYSLVITTPDPGLPGNGNSNITTVEPWIATGNSLSDMVPDANASVQVGLPSQVCTPAGCFQNLEGLTTSVSWLPGSESCTTPIASCSKEAGSGLDLGLSPVDFPIGGLRVPVNPLEPCAGTAGTCIAVQHGTTTGGTPWTYTFDYGRLYPGVIAASSVLDTSGTPYTGTFQYQEFPGTISAP